MAPVLPLLNYAKVGGVLRPERTTTCLGLLKQCAKWELLDKSNIRSRTSLNEISLKHTLPLREGGGRRPRERGLKANKSMTRARVKARAGGWLYPPTHDEKVQGRNPIWCRHKYANHVIHNVWLARPQKGSRHGDRRGVWCESRIHWQSDSVLTQWSGNNRQQVRNTAVQSYA